MSHYAPPTSPAVEPPGTGTADSRGVGARGVLVSMALGLVGVFGYLGTLVLTNLLDAPSFRSYAAAQMLVGMVGTFAAALIPMPVAHVVRTSAPGSEERRRGMAFAWSVCAVCGLVASAVTGLITAAFASTPVVVAVAVSTPMLFVISPVFGWLQGELRFGRYGLAAVLEVVTRVALAVGAVELGLGPAGAITGFTVGVLVVLALSPRALLRDLAWRPAAMRERARWAETGGIAITQLVVAAFVGADVVLVALLDADAAQSAGYQALSTLAKGPAYLAVGAAVVAFPLLRSGGAEVDRILTATLRSFGRLAFTAAAVIATVPHELALLVIPERYAGSLDLLPLLAVAGIGYAGTTLLATLMAALRAYRRCQAGLLVAVVVMPVGVALGWRLDGVTGFAVGVTAASVIAATVLWIAAAPLLPRGTLLLATRGLSLAAVLAGLLWAASLVPLAWCAGVLLLGAGVLHLSRERRPDLNVEENR